MKTEPSFNLSDFKKWLNEHASNKRQKNKNSIQEGTRVKVFVKKEKLLEQLKKCKENASLELEKIADKFKHSIFVVESIHGNKAALKPVNSNSDNALVHIPRLYLRRQKEEGTSSEQQNSNQGSKPKKVCFQQTKKTSVA